MRLWRGFVLLCLFALSACSSSSTPDNAPDNPDDSKQTISTIVAEPGDYNLTIATGGMERSYLLHIPTGYDGSKALPLVFVLHGYGGTAQGMVTITGLTIKADQEGFIVAYLNGSGEGPSWNNGLTNTSTADDVGFVRTLASQLKEELNVDGTRVYAAGFSNGGMMSHRLGAELSDILAGVAVVAGTIGNRQTDGSYAITPTPIGPIPVLMIHGKQDTSVLYDGGTDVIPELDVKPVSDAVAFWTEANGCGGLPQSSVSPNGNILVDAYMDCAGGSEVRLVTIVNGGHQWPTLESQTEFPATIAIWKFFSEHSLPSTY